DQPAHPVTTLPRGSDHQVGSHSSNECTKPKLAFGQKREEKCSVIFVTAPNSRLSTASRFCRSFGSNRTPSALRTPKGSVMIAAELDNLRGLPCCKSSTSTKRGFQRIT